MTIPFLDLVDLAKRCDPAFTNYDKAACLKAAQLFQKEAWASARQHHVEGASGGAVLRQLSESADELVRGVGAFAAWHVTGKKDFFAKAALCALGGYGRCELSPYSDLDVVLLHERARERDIESFTSYFVPFIWDLGFRVGFAVHSLKEAVQLARQDNEVFTAYLQARVVVGDGVVRAQLKVKLQGMVSKRAPDVLAIVKQRQDENSLPAHFRDLHDQEPNLKESAGGLRDYHAAMWMIWLRHEAVSLDDLVNMGLLGQDEHLELIDSLDFLWRVRNEIHFHTGKPENQLTFALQKHIAQAFGYGSGNQKSIDRFLRDYYLAARRMRRFLTIAERIGEGPSDKSPPKGDELLPGIHLHNGEIRAGAGDRHWFEEYPPRLMQLFWECARKGAVLDGGTERRVQANLGLVNDTFRSDALVRRFFLAICRRPYQAGGVLRQMASSGLLAAYLPEFKAIQGIVRYEDFHSYPVDEHTIRAVEALAEIPIMKGAVGGVMQRVIEHLQDPHVLVLAIICHDLGKAEGEEHVEEGVRLVNDMGARAGFPEDVIERVGFLVKHHMLMTNISMYRDIDDISIVKKFADTMTTVERLRELLVLTFTDLRAVGPNVWTEWKGALLLKLFLKAERLLSGRTVDEDWQFWEHAKAKEIEELAPEALRAEMSDFIRRMGERYLFAFSPETIVQHVHCLQEARNSGLSVHSHALPELHTTEVVICTPDKAGLFSAIAGCFAAQLIDVRASAVFTTPDGLALDVFQVVDAAHQRPLSSSQESALASALEAVLLEGHDVSALVDASKKRLFALLQPRVSLPPRIAFDNHASDTDTVVDIETGDRTGLLYDMTRAMAGMDMEIRSARIVTDARRARDAFYVRFQGNKIAEKPVEDEVRQRLEAAILGLEPAETKGDS